MKKIITHRVREGESLYKISEKYHGEGAFWDLIYVKNKELIGPDPDLIHPGQVLVIPNTVLVKNEYRFCDCKPDYDPLSKRAVDEALEDIRHCIGIGNIILQLPEDKSLVDTIVASLEKHTQQDVLDLKNSGTCSKCSYSLYEGNYKSNYCPNCGQRLNWNL